jgi:hypothetical protein
MIAILNGTLIVYRNSNACTGTLPSFFLFTLAIAIKVSKVARLPYAQTWAYRIHELCACAMCHAEHPVCGVHTTHIW